VKDLGSTVSLAMLNLSRRDTSLINTLTNAAGGREGNNQDFSNTLPALDGQL
jgi:hypothetical protein